MDSYVLDASALLAFLFAENGGDKVAPHLSGGVISAVNYSETLARALDRGMDLQHVVTLIGCLQLSHWPFDAEQAAFAASLRAVTKTRGLSFADRACLSLAVTLKKPVLTADRNWHGLSIGTEIVQIR